MNGGVTKHTMFFDYPLTLHDQIHDLAFSRALSPITSQKHVIVCKTKFSWGLFSVIFGSEAILAIFW